jgi:CDP-glycerol glycerophosphotransferase
VTKYQLAKFPLVRRVPQALARTRDDVVLFQSWRGRYADSPRGIAEELHRRDVPLRHVWVLDDDASQLPDGAVVVRPGSGQHLAALGRARYIVTNTTLPGYFRKKRGVTYVQTWHGTPLKRIALDLDRLPLGRRDAFRPLRRDVAAWDALIAQNEFSAGIFRRAFEYDGDILETGYPHNDVLKSAEAGRIRERVREQLGIRPDERAVLYAPTWRDTETFESELDLEAVTEALGDDHVLLLRGHPLVAATVCVPDRPRLKNVTGVPDIRDLHLAADVLVTDYSAAMFDFAVTGKPMLFYTYDLERYRDETRGFYFDFESTAPGPLLRTTDDVIDALRDLDAATAGFAPAYEAFVARFCHLDDGRAAARVVDRVFSA